MARRRRQPPQLALLPLLLLLPCSVLAFHSPQIPPDPRCRRLRLCSSSQSSTATTTNNNNKNGPRIVVIGAGVGGLSVAGRLKRRLPGASITVLEQSGREAAGGRLGEYVWEGHRWETGPSLLLLPDVYEETFAAVGGKFRALVDVVKVRGAARAIT